MTIHGDFVHIATKGFSDMHDLTGSVRQIVAASGIREGLVNVFAVGSTATITTVEYEPALVQDVRDAFEALWPADKPTRHGDTWGDDNGFSHLRATMTGPALTCPVHRGEVVLGTWQQIVVIDHDNNPRDRKVFVQVMGSRPDSSTA